MVVTLNLSSNVVGDSNDETNTQASRLREAFANGSSVNIRFLKIQMSEMVQQVELLESFVVPVMTIGNTT